MPRLVLIGHRGVGKTSLLERLKAYQPDFTVFLDLDAEIERHSGQTIAALFTNEGEATFRQLETKVFQSILSEHPSFVCAVGGGFPVQEIPEEIHCLWLQRATDAFGRIFLDRPRLNPQVSELEEFRQRANSRMPFFLQRANEIYIVPEGVRGIDSTEEMLFSHKLESLSDGYLTISPWHLERPEFLQKIASSGFELRSDWLTPAQMQKVLKGRTSPTLLSVRRSETAAALLQLRADRGGLLDWPLEIGAAPELGVDVVSAHEMAPNESLSMFLTRLERAGGQRHLKAAPIIADFHQLKILLEWHSEDSANRSILPRSREGRWTWVRLLQKGRQKINFWKDGTGSAPDQPTLFQWLAIPDSVTTFAAVLGDPVAHSKTPIEHKAFFAGQTMPVFAIQIYAGEIEVAFPLLRCVGLTAAAVTSPHKLFAFCQCQVTDSVTDQLKSANSISCLPSQPIHGTNSDVAGLMVLAREVQTNVDPELMQRMIVVWGGGGTLAGVQKVFGKASAYSVRSGEPRENQAAAVDAEVLIWAADPGAAWPQNFQKIKLVLDLNYREDSAARSFAKHLGAKYISGDIMFLAQAEAQRDFFKLRRE